MLFDKVLGFAYKTLLKFALSSMPCTWDAVLSKYSSVIAYHLLRPDQLSNHWGKISLSVAYKSVIASGRFRQVH